ncbi:MAG TPA: hypothetical protein VN176_11275 [Verrucomicrobiae bacterium]|nr:hypothetical protein [Verrucomicrobiae bacterium]
MPGISAEMVRGEVARFWKAYSTRSGDVMEAMYFSTASTFGASSPRSESARVTMARRLREFAQRRWSLSADIGIVDVQIAGDMAIASYPYHFHLMTTSSDGNQCSVEVPYSAGTQIFIQDNGGILRIIHEHFCAAEAGKTKVVPAESLSATERLAGKKPSDAGAASVITGWVPATDAVLVEQVRVLVRRFWELFCSKSKEEFEQMYFPTAVVWAVGAKRSEPARLALVRRAREFFGPEESVKAELGRVDVQTIGADLAVASYSFRFHIIQMQANGKRMDIDMPNCRSTQVFRRDETGTLRLMHEHASTAGVPTYKELPAAPGRTR